MIICRSCGFENEDNADFCASCGTFLEWTGERVQETPPPRPATRPAAPPNPPSPTAAAAATPPAPPLSPKPKPTPAPEPPRPAPTGRSSVRITRGTPPRGATQTPPAATPAPTEPTQSVAEPKADIPDTDGAKTATQAAKPEAPAAEEAAAAPVTDDGAKAAEAPARSATDEDAEAAAAAKAKAEADARIRALVTRPTATTPVSRTAARPPSAPRPAAPSGTGAQTPRMPQAQQPTAQKPGAPKPKVPPKPARPKEKARQYNPGDVICGDCGEGNPPNRKFCKKCGASLVNATVVEVPWWKRFFQRKKKVYKAGERKTRADGTVKAGRSGFWRKAKNVFLLLATVLVVLSLFGPWKGAIRDAKDRVRGFFVQTYEPLHADGAQATSSLPDHPPELAIDGTINYSWQEAAQGDGENQKLVLTFNRQVKIDRIGFRSGVSNKQEEFLAQPRPRQVHIAFSDGSASDITLKDSPDFQNFKVTARNVVSMEITVISVYTSFRGGHDMGIAEVELFTKK